MKKKMAATTLAAVCLALGAGASFASKKEKKPSAEPPAKEQFTATVSPPPMNINDTATIVVIDYTTDAEMKDYGAAYLQGADGAVRAKFRKGSMGYFAFGSFSFTFVLVRSIPNGSSRTEFMIGFAPQAGLQGSNTVFWNQRFYPDYPYDVINIQLDSNGNGRGVLYQSVKLQFDAQGTPHVTPRERYPVELLDVHPVKK